MREEGRKGGREEGSRCVRGVMYDQKYTSMERRKGGDLPSPCVAAVM